MSARVRDVMTTRVVAVRGGATFKDIVALPIVVTPDEPVTSAARLMYHARVKRLPVVEEGGLSAACHLTRPGSHRDAARADLT